MDIKDALLIIQIRDGTKKYEQYIQAYKELMVDFLYYSPDLDYDDLSIKEIDILKEMASFLVTQAEININDLM